LKSILIITKMRPAAYYSQTTSPHGCMFYYFTIFLGSHHFHTDSLHFTDINFNDL